MNYQYFVTYQCLNCQAIQKIEWADSIPVAPQEVLKQCDGLAAVRSCEHCKHIGLNRIKSECGAHIQYKGPLSFEWMVDDVDKFDEMVGLFDSGCTLTTEDESESGEIKAIRDLRDVLNGIVNDRYREYERFDTLSNIVTAANDVLERTKQFAESDATLFGFPVTTSAPPVVDLDSAEIGGPDDIGKPRSEWSTVRKLTSDSEGEVKQ